MDDNAQVIELSVEDKQRMAQQFMATANPLPDVPEPPSDLVHLPGGLTFDSTDYHTAVVRELTGEHEEAMARALKSGNNFHFLQVLLECGTASVGDISEPSKVKQALRAMLVGDRDELVLAIRTATYGDSLEVLDWKCPSCDGTTTLVLPLNQEDVVPRKRLEAPDDARFAVELRKGASATVHLATGVEQLYVYDKPDLTGAERDSRLLSKCIESVTDVQGRVHNLVLEPSYVLKLSVPDRRTILKELQERQPGPQYTEVKFTHEECGNVITLAIGLVDLFRDLLLFL